MDDKTAAAFSNWSRALSLMSALRVNSGTGFYNPSRFGREWFDPHLFQGNPIIELFQITIAVCSVWIIASEVMRRARQ
jgi:hypothetical protein